MVAEEISDYDVLKSLWGVDSQNENDSLTMILDDEINLEAYFSYCHKQLKRTKDAFSSHQTLLLMEQLRRNTSLTRKQSRDIATRRLEQNETKKAEAEGTDPPANEAGKETDSNNRFEYLGGEEGERKIDLALDVAASIMLSVHVTHDPDSIEPGRSKIQWEDAETLDAFIQKAFPQIETGSDEPITPIKPSKLRALHFESYAGIQIQWTEHLYDHLQLSTSENSKILKVFQLPCLLEAALEVLKLAEYTKHGQLGSKGRQSHRSSAPRQDDDEAADNGLAFVVHKDDNNALEGSNVIRKATKSHENIPVRKHDDAESSKGAQVEYDMSEKMKGVNKESADQGSLKL
jgi:hypothetical protein